MKRINTLILATMLFSQPVLAEIFVGETSHGNFCSIELNEANTPGEIDIQLIADSTAYAFDMPENKVSHSVSLLERGKRYYSTYIGSPITIFGIGVRNIKIDLQLKDDGSPRSYDFKVTNKSIFGTKVICKNLQPNP